MAGKQSPQNVIEAYRRRQQMMPFIIWGLAILLVVVGVIILVVSLTGPNRGSLLALFASPTPSATATATPSPTQPTPTPSNTPTVTETPLPTETPTPNAPFEYTVQEGDTCYDLAIKYNVDLLVLLAINNFPLDQCPIRVGDKILIPIPGQTLPTATPLPTNLPRGTRIEYYVVANDTLDIIAARFNSTVDAIMRENKLEDKNKIFVGQKLIIPVNIVTPTPTRAPTSTPAGTTSPTFTVTPSATPSP